MAKFKVGDKVIRTKGDFGIAKEGKEYEVTFVSQEPFGGIKIKGDTHFSYSADSFDLVSPLPTDRPLTYDETQMLKKGDVVFTCTERIIKSINEKEIRFTNSERNVWILDPENKKTKGDLFFVSHGKEESKEEKKAEVLSDEAKNFIAEQAKQRAVDKMAGCEVIEKLHNESMEAHINAHKEFLKRSTTKTVSQILYRR